ncbi:hypothetical protein NPIL_288721 [Nephila pilipes]|uniref:Uncharacterized protein n=1 Tax=Nephila pilipes TaxID=299642 RepID=A0A8X6TY52_NEPPI|nr:hypothetical protein NPIL_288721 [Nephila pilipes]
MLCLPIGYLKIQFKLIPCTTRECLLQLAGVRGAWNSDRWNEPALLPPGQGECVAVQSARELVGRDPWRCLFTSVAQSGRSQKLSVGFGLNAKIIQVIWWSRRFRLMEWRWHVVWFHPYRSGGGVLD